jgi:sirohydrochlorin ferrochelatase
LVYPMFMADGWFTQTVLPRRLGDQAGPILPPFGLDPRLPALADSWLRREIDAQGWTVEDTAVFVAGHGSGRSARPAEVTYAFGQALEARLSPRVLRCGFVEQPPFLAPSCDFLGPKSIALPFFAAKRGHVLDDLPEAMNAVGFTGLRLEPIGLHPEVPKLIAESLQAAAEAL